VLGEIAREDLGDKLTGRKGKGVREPGRIAQDQGTEARDGSQIKRTDW